MLVSCYGSTSTNMVYLTTTFTIIFAPIGLFGNDLKETCVLDNTKSQLFKCRTIVNNLWISRKVEILLEKSFVFLICDWSYESRLWRHLSNLHIWILERKLNPNAWNSNERDWDWNEHPIAIGMQKSFFSCICSIMYMFEYKMRSWRVLIQTRCAPIRSCYTRIRI